MERYVASRLLWLPFILLIVTFITFVLGRYGPGDPVEILMGQHNNPEAVQRIREQRGLNDNIMVQYGRYVWDVSPVKLKSTTPFIRFGSDFGESFKYRGRTVNELLKDRLRVSIQLNVAAMIIWIGLGVPIGLFAAMKQGTMWDTAAVMMTLAGQSIPIFLTAPVLLLVFALKLDILPTHGWGESWVGGFLNTRIVLPAVAMGIPGIAIMARLTRASTLEVLGQDYIRTARAKGLSEAVVQRRHVLRNSMIPVVTTVGFMLAGLAFTSFIIERFFGIPGVGNLLIESIFARDYPIINAVVIIGTTLFVLSNLLVDVVYPFLDPRIRLGGSEVA